MAYSNTDTNVNQYVAHIDSSLDSDVDLLFRIQQRQQTGNTPSRIKVGVAPTQNITQPISRLINENELFRHVVRNLWQAYKYHQEYEAFLLNGYSEEEFLQIAEQYAVSFQVIPVKSLTWASSILLTVLDNSLTSSDLSVLLNVDPTDIENTLSTSSSIHPIPLGH